MPPKKKIPTKTVEIKDPVMRLTLVVEYKMSDTDLEEITDELRSAKDYLENQGTVISEVITYRGEAI